jgi:hypothetical protein
MTLDWQVATVNLRAGARVAGWQTPEIDRAQAAIGTAIEL